MLKKIITRCKSHRAGLARNAAMREEQERREKAFLEEQEALLVQQVALPVGGIHPIHFQPRDIDLGVCGMRDSGLVFNTATGAIESTMNPPAAPERAAEAAPNESALPAVSEVQPAEPARGNPMPLSNDAAEWDQWEREQRVRAQKNRERHEAFLASKPWNEHGYPDVDRIREFHGYCSEAMIAHYLMKGRAAVSAAPTSLAAVPGEYGFR